MTTVSSGACALATLTTLVTAEPPEAVLSTNQRAHITRALHQLNMTEADLGFDKDVAEPRLALKRLRACLGSPLDLPILGDEALAAVASTNEGSCWTLAGHWLELPGEQGLPVSVTGHKPSPELPAPLQEPIAAFLNTVQSAHTSLESAFRRLEPNARSRLAAGFLGGTFLIEDDREAYAALEQMGIPAAMLDDVIRKQHVINPQPDASNTLDRLESIDMGALLTAAQAGRRALTDLAAAVSATEAWPSSPLALPSPYGPILIGTTGADHYATSALLILDPAGDDTYEPPAGVAQGLAHTAFASILDLSGNDAYLSDGILGPGSALFGLSLLHDLAGDDTHRAAYAGQGVALFGAASLTDDAGDDRYEARALAQGAGYAGVGILRDRGGNDRYNVGYNGQAFAGVRSVGLLIDDDGNDRYTAGGQHPDYDRHTHRYLSTAQGFAIGMRPFAGGGIAALIDRAGNDVYIADVYGQGVGYWYAAGMLLDEGGHDSYQLYEYGQGAGIHLALGLLSDRAGNDVYSGYSLSQGCAHDYAVGMLFDHGGNDTYTADHFSQGLAINNALGLLVDSAGRDGYFALRTDQSQGIGSDGRDREYGALALLLDLGGKDRYSAGARDGARVIRPNHGIIYDVED